MSPLGAVQTLSLPDPQAGQAPENAPERSPDDPRPVGPRLDGTADTRPGTEAGLGPEVVESLEAVRRNSLSEVYGPEWEVAAERFDEAASTEGRAAYERLQDTPEAYGEVTGDRTQAPRAAEVLWARERVLAQARHDYSESQPGGTVDETSVRTEAPGRPLGLRPEPTAWVGVDGAPVQMSRREDGRIELSGNASPELARVAGYVSASGSTLAVELFVEASRGVTKLNFALGDSAVRPGLHGLHEPHDADGPTPWVSGDPDGTTGQFARPPDVRPDAAGNLAYREATVTLFEDTFTPEAVQGISNRYGNGDPLSRENAMVAVLAHELFHDIDDASLRAIMSRIGGTADPYAVEGEAYRVERLVLAQIQGAP